MRLALSRGSGSRVPNTTARLIARGRRAHHRCIVEMWPCRSDFSRADSTLTSLSGSFSSISRGRSCGGSSGGFDDGFGVDAEADVERGLPEGGQGPGWVAHPVQPR